MSQRSHLLGLLERVAEALGPDAPGVVFVGGAVLALYDLPLEPRPTDDVDLTVNASRLEYEELLQRLRRRGFRHSREKGAPICRFECGDPPVVVDVMAADPALLGFSNRWYRDAIAHAQQFPLPSGRVIRALSPLYFVATKLEAFAGRGGGDYTGSHDLDDLLSVLAVAPDLFDTIDAGESAAARDVRGALVRLAGDEDFVDAIAYHFPGTRDGEAEARELATRLQALREAHPAEAAAS